MSRVLRIGVNTSIAIIVVGLAILFVKGSADNFTLSQLANFGSGSVTLDSSEVPLTGLISGLISLDAIYYFVLGLWVLIMTPVTVVFIAFFAYIREKNYLYVALSGIVLVNIFIAMLIIPGLVGK